MDQSLGIVKANVVVVGAGPVGLTLANTLAQYGVDCVLLERNTRAGILPKMDLSNPRTMEIFGRLGFVDDVRRAGWPLDARFDVLVGPSLIQEPYCLLSYPSILEMQAQIDASNDGSMPREAYERISQYHLEELLRAKLDEQPSATAMFGHRLVSAEDLGDRVELDVERQDGAEVKIECRFVVGCDGGNSAIRSHLGIEMQGQAAVGRNYMIFFKAPRLLELTGLKPFRHFYLAGQRQATLVAQDDLERWSLHIKIPFELDLSTLSPRDEIREALGLDVDPELLYIGAWTPHLLVAERFASGNVFLAGDAVHQYIPTGGFGMNTGITEADNLAWKLAAVLQGWGGAQLLNSYEAERRPVALRNCRASAYATQGVVSWRSVYDPVVLDDTPIGRSKRRELAEAIDLYQRRSHEQSDIELGYRYESSPICFPEAVVGPATESLKYAPLAVTGARLPHAWIEPGVSVHDRCGKGMTLLVLGAAAADVAAFKDAADRRGIPLTILELSGPHLQRLYREPLLLLRPDLHIAWRGQSVPAEGASLVLARATGH